MFFSLFPILFTDSLVRLPTLKCGTNRIKVHQLLRTENESVSLRSVCVCVCGGRDRGDPGFWFPQLSGGFGRHRVICSEISSTVCFAGGWERRQGVVGNGRSNLLSVGCECVYCCTAVGSAWSRHALWSGMDSWKGGSSSSRRSWTNQIGTSGACLVQVVEGLAALVIEMYLQGEVTRHSSQHGSV